MVDYSSETILITGGTGSFGTTMARHLLTRDVAQVRVLSRDEAKQHQMRVDFNDPRLDFYVGDVRDLRSVERAADGATRIFHAAALKQVPSCEFFPLEAVMTNIVGSQNVIDAAERAGAHSVVCLSTDKAVMPINAMGMSKALMEKIAQASARAHRSETTVSTVRYGNVLYSRGSVVPLFVKQIWSGEQLTVTEPKMTRFLMPLAHAVDLVEFAFFNANPGDTFIRRAPATTIGALAEAVQRLFGVPDPVKEIGIRHGEKMYETLATIEELGRSQDMGDYYRVPMDSRDLNYADYFEIGETARSSVVEYNSDTTDQLGVAETQELLMTLPDIRSELDRWTRR